MPPAHVWVKPPSTTPADWKKHLSQVWQRQQHSETRQALQHAILKPVTKQDQDAVNNSWSCTTRPSMRPSSKLLAQLKHPSTRKALKHTANKEASNCAVLPRRPSCPTYSGSLNATHATSATCSSARQRIGSAEPQGCSRSHRPPTPVHAYNARHLSCGNALESRATATSATATTFAATCKPESTASTSSSCSSSKRRGERPSEHGTGESDAMANTDAHGLKTPPTSTHHRSPVKARSSLRIKAFYSTRTSIGPMCSMKLKQEQPQQKSRAFLHNLPHLRRLQGRPTTEEFLQAYSNLRGGGRP